MVSFSPSHTAMCSEVSRTNSISRCFLISGIGKQNEDALLLIDTAEVKQIAVLREAHRAVGVGGQHVVGMEDDERTRLEFGGEASAGFDVLVGGKRIVSHLAAISKASRRAWQPMRRVRPSADAGLLRSTAARTARRLHRQRKGGDAIDARDVDADGLAEQIENRTAHVCGAERNVVWRISGKLSVRMEMPPFA